MNCPAPKLQTMHDNIEGLGELCPDGFDNISAIPIFFVEKVSGMMSIATESVAAELKIQSAHEASSSRSQPTVSDFCKPQFNGLCHCTLTHFQVKGHPTKHSSTNPTPFPAPLHPHPHLPLSPSHCRSTFYSSCSVVQLLNLIQMSDCLFLFRPVLSKGHS